MSESPGPNARTNRLARESSPYLLLHQHNPVDWYAWGAEAFERARREDKPIFLSVGYSTCYWCHVMERESFSDPDIAGLMNREFVSIKLDREERPDLDEIYMAATQLLTEHGGWPNSVFLTPKLEPFYAGTYFPPADRHGLPGFPSLLRALSQAWRDRRDEIEAQAEELVHAIGHHLGDRGAGGATPPDPATPGRALAALERRFDPLWGGFGGAPKFPTPSNLLLLFEFAEERPRAAEMLHATLDQMARGGLYDQLGGGFHRYATDREWRVPHFEKMLYDNGLLLALYAREYDRTADPEMARVARETAAFLERELSAPEGGFWSAIDAETGGHEGAFYVWSRDELLAALGPEDLAFLAPLYGFEGPPFFEGSRYVLHLPAPLEQAAERRRLTREELLAQMGPLRQRLFALRALRRRPLTDDKVLADWNGLAIAGLAEAGTALGDAALVERAARAAKFVVEEMRGAEGVLLHAWRAGQGKVAAFLSDYAYLVQGLLVLHRASGERRWLEEAIALSDEQEERLADPLGGYFAAAASPDVLFRSKDLFDGATPAPNAVAVLNHLELWSRTGEERWLERAERSLRAFAPLVERQVDAARTMAVATRRWHELKGTVAEAAAERVAEPTSRPLSESEGAPTGPVSAELEIATSTAPGGDGWRPFRLNIAIADGWHIHANPSSHEYLMPTELDAEGAELRGVAYPPGRALRIREDGPPLAVYQGSLTLTGEVRPEAGSSAWLLLGYQPCDDRRCLAPMRLAIAIDR